MSKFRLNEHGIAGIYLLAMRLPAGERERDVLADVLRLVYLSGVEVGQKNPGASLLAVQDEIKTIAEKLQQTCIPPDE